MLPWNRRLRRCLAITFLAALAASRAGAADRDAAPGGGGAPGDDAREAWIPLDHLPDHVAAKDAWIRPPRGQSLALDEPFLRGRLAVAPIEDARPVAESPAIIALPRPDGTFERFAFVESPIMEPALAAQVPELRTYLGQGLDHPSATVRFDMTPMGFHAQVFTPDSSGEGMVAYYIDPVALGDSAHYTSYWRGDLRGLPLRNCTTPNIDPPPAAGGGITTRGGPAVQRRIIRLAVAATGEYTTFVSPAGNVTAANGLAAIMTAINRVNQVYEIDLAARLVLVANNLNIVYTDPATDPYSGNLGDMQGQNQTNLDNVIGNANYDLGHLFDQRVGGGNAGGIGTVCNNSNKGTGFTGAGAPTGDFFWIDYVAHEMGHQLGGTHTFNNCGDNGQRTGSTAYEPGSGISIMAYAGICGADDLNNPAPPAGATIPFFNFSSIDQIRAKINEGGTCLAAQATGNNAPVLPAQVNLVLPVRTPFRLTAIGATDANGTASHTHSWEQADLGSATPLGPDTGNGEPLFRPFPPVPGLTRDFPRAVNPAGMSTQLGETLPLFPRTSTFTILVRDNFAGGGGVNRANATVQFVDSAGFRVTEPAAGQLECDTSVTIRWDPAGTNQAPISCANVAIFYSTTGGANLDFPISLGTFPNNGVANVTIPATPTANGRFLVRGVERPFFAVSNTFTTDVTPPDVTCPSNITRSNDPGLCGASVPFTVTVTDNCPGVSVVCRVGAQAITSPHFFPVGLTTVTCTATDGAGLTDQCSFTVRVNDTEPPVVTASDATVELDEFGNATLTPATFLASATDNCLSAECPIVLSLSQSVFLCPPVNVPIPVTVFARDCYNNVGQRVVTVTFPDPDCNDNGLPDICDILSGRSKDCDNNRVPDECQCVWDNGLPPENFASVEGQISHFGAGAGSGAKVADDMYLCPGHMHRIFFFTGEMLTSTPAPLRKARIELYADCNGLPAGEPIFSRESTDHVVLAGPDADGFFLVQYKFDLCADHLWLEGGRAYWWSLIGLGTCDLNDYSSWAAAQAPVAGRPPVKADGAGILHCYPVTFDDWETLDACCIGCVNMAYRVVGIKCPILWNQSPALVGGGEGGILSENLSPTQRPRGADDFVVKTCQDQRICLIDAWVWSNCNPIRGFLEIYRNDCRVPGTPVVSLINPTVIPTGQSILIGGVRRDGYILRFEPTGLTLPAGQTLWISAGADRTGSQNARTYFAFGGDCTAACARHGYASQSFVPPTPVRWNAVGPDLAFRIAAADQTEEPDVITTPPAEPACPADVNRSGSVTVQDLFDFLAAWFAGCP